MAIKYVEINNLLYEINDRGERILVRSTDSSNRVYLRFTNQTCRPVDIWWRDFRGTKHHYICLDPGTFFDVNSYTTHPWEFTDANTKERYVVNNTPIYRAPSNIGGMLFRTNWNITISVRSLKESAMLKLASILKTPCCALSVGLPKTLEEELHSLMTVIQGVEAAEQEE